MQSEESHVVIFQEVLRTNINETSCKGDCYFLVTEKTLGPIIGLNDGILFLPKTCTR